MKDQINTIREALDILRGAVGHEENIHTADIALTALSELEAMAGEPVGWVFRRSLIQKFRWHRDKPVGQEALLYWEPVYTAAPVAQQPQAESQDVGQLEYRGNSVAYIHQKMTAYRSAIDAAWEAMRDAGHPPDGRTPLAQAITKALAPQQAEAVPSDVVRDAERLVWAMHNMSNPFGRHEFGFTQHIMERGGSGDVEDCRSYIDAAIASQGAKT